MILLTYKNLVNHNLFEDLGRYAFLLHAFWIRNAYSYSDLRIDLEAENVFIQHQGSWRISLPPLDLLHTLLLGSMNCLHTPSWSQCLGVSGSIRFLWMVLYSGMYLTITWWWINKQTKIQTYHEMLLLMLVASWLLWYAMEVVIYFLAGSC